MLSPEPILDVVRGLSTVASFAIVSGQFFRLINEIFTSECETCRGSGRIICKHCRGSKTLRRRQGVFTIQRLQVVDRDPADIYPCVYCGPSPEYDAFIIEDDDETEAYNIMDNFKAAYANKRVPYPGPILAGTVPCPGCDGNPVVHRHTPDFMRIAGQNETFHTITTKRRGRFRRQAPEVIERVRPREYFEYPRQRPFNPEGSVDTMIAAIQLKGLSEAGKAREKEELALEKMELSGSEQLTPDDYVLPYIDDDDSEAEDDALP